MVFKAIVETWYFPRLIDNGKSHASMHTCMFVNNVTGVEPTGLKAGQRAPFTVDAKGAGDGELDVFVEGPQGEEKVDIKSNGDGTYSCIYYPGKFGKYVVNVTWSSVQVPNSPFNVKVATAVDASRIKAYGPGLERGKGFFCFSLRAGFIVLVSYSTYYFWLLALVHE